MDKLIDLGLKVKESVVSELEEAYVERFDYREKIADPNPKWKPTAKKPARPMIKNPVTKRDHLLLYIKKDMRRKLADHRTEKELKVKRENQKSLEDLI